MNEQSPPQTPEPTPRRRPTGPNWSLIMVLFGVAAALFAIGIRQSTEPLFGGARLRWKTADAIARIKEWDNVPGTRLYGEPELTEHEDGSLEIVATFGGEDRIGAEELTFTCGNLKIPTNWTMESCKIDPNNNRVYKVVLRRN